METTYLDILYEIIKLVRSSEITIKFKLDFLERAITTLLDSYEDYRKNDKEVDKCKSKAIDTFETCSKEILNFLLILEERSQSDYYNELAIYFKQFLTIVTLTDPNGYKDPLKSLAQTIIKIEISNLGKLLSLYILNSSHFDQQKEGQQIRILISNFALSSKDIRFQIELNDLLDKIISTLEKSNILIQQNILLILKDSLLELASSINTSFNKIENQHKKEYRLLYIKLITTLVKLCEKSTMQKDYELSQKICDCLIEGKYNFTRIDGLIRENFCSNDTSILNQTNRTSKITKREMKILEQLIVEREEIETLKEQIALNQPSIMRSRCIIS